MDPPKPILVTLINPVSKKPIEGARLNVTFAENIGTDFGPRRNVEVTNGYGKSTIPYQSNDGHEEKFIFSQIKMEKLRLRLQVVMQR